MLRGLEDVDQVGQAEQVVLVPLLLAYHGVEASVKMLIALNILAPLPSPSAP
jgi:hypothetical protein